MNNLFRTFLALGSTLFINTAMANYEKKVPGFYLNHFDQSKDLKDLSCKPFLKTVYRGGQPIFDNSNNWIKKITASKIKMVFDLRSETTNAGLERDTLLKNGIGYVKLPLKTSGTTQDEFMIVEVALPSANGFSSAVITKTKMTNVEATIYVLDLMQNVISAQSENAIYLHCQRGEDRTGLMAALLRQCSGTGWKSEFNTYGGVMYKPLAKLMSDVQKIRK